MSKCRKSEPKKLQNDKPISISEKKLEVSQDAIKIMKLDIKFRSEAQETFWKLMDKKEIVICEGSAGTGKSHLAILKALDLLKNEPTKYKKIILTTPVIEADEKLGFLPGPQPMDAKILTPDGWTTMGDLKINDKIVTPEGISANVIGIYPKGKKMVYKVTLDDGSSTECCIDHLWYTQNYDEWMHGKTGQIRTTKQIMDTLKVGIKYNSKVKLNHYLPRNKAIQYNCSDLPIPPYTLGVLLGDGSLGTENNTPSISNTDSELIDRVRNELSTIECQLTNYNNEISYSISGKFNDNNKTARQIVVTDLNNGTIVKYSSIEEALKYITYLNKNTLSYSCKHGSIIDNLQFGYEASEARFQNKITEHLYILGLLNKYAYDKFIPDQYLRNSSVEDRVSLLRGLLDTDGGCGKKGKATFTTVSLQLAKDIMELTRSIGGRAKLRVRDRIGNNPQLRNGRIIKSNFINYDVNISIPSDINPFHISRKADRFYCNYIHFPKIKSIVPVIEKEVQCILIDDERHLYITDDFIVTHNTIDEKMAPYTYSSLYIFEKILGKEKVKRMLDREQIKVIPFAYMRGINIDNSVVIADEMQNTTKNQMLTLLTRIGENSKFLLNGDLAQSDRYAVKDIEKCGLNVAMNSLKNVIEIGIFKFDITDIIRNPIISKIIEAFK